MSEQPGSEKLSISFPSGTRDQLRALVDSGAIPSVSAFVSEAVTERLRRDRFDRKIAALMGAAPLPADAIDWACRIVGATPEQTAAMHATFGADGTPASAAS